MVRSPPPQAAVAASGRRARRSLSGLAVGNHAAADRRQDGRTLFREIRRAMAQRRRAGACVARRRAADVGRARLLFAGAQFARLRGRGARRSWRRFPGQRGRPVRAAGDWSLYRGGDCRDCIRSPDHAGRRQYRARGVAVVRRRGAAAKSKTVDPAAGGDAARRYPRRRREVSRRRREVSRRRRKVSCRR